jgi:mevalonate kinase
MARTAFAPGKIIVSGEYAVVFGYPGIAVPSTRGIAVTFEDEREADLDVIWEGIPWNEQWEIYLHHIVKECEHFLGKPVHGRLTIDNALQLGKGMGSSSALLIAVMRCLLGEECESKVRTVEDLLNPGHSGIDFAVIWYSKPIKFQQGKPLQPIELLLTLHENARLIDTGAPGESTPQLIAWVKSRESDVRHALETIACCAERLIRGDDPFEVLREHHRAQLLLGVVPEPAREVITHVERLGGSGKIIGAGGRTGGGGIVLALHQEPAHLEEHLPLTYPSFTP